MSERAAGLFVSGTGTGVGKTWLTRGLARLATRAGKKVAALKPIETGVVSAPADALAIGRAALRPELAFVPGLIRMRLPVSPRAATLAGDRAVPMPQLIEVVSETCVGSDLTLIEGAGGLWVPLTERHSTADLAAALGLPIVLAAPDRLGVLSDVLAYLSAAQAARLDVAAVVLVDIGVADDSTRHNSEILRERSDVPIHRLGRSIDDDDALAAAAADGGLETLIGLGRPTDPTVNS